MVPNDAVATEPAIPSAVRLRRRLRRARRMVNQVLGRDLWFWPQVRCATVRLGSEYGGWVICPEGIGRQATVYSVGVGEDISFDLALIARFRVTVQAFDPTPKSVCWLSQQALPPELVVHRLGVAAYDGLGRFVLPRADWVSYQLVDSAAEGRDGIEAPVQRVATIMQRLGHARLDVLKMDIEGAEYGVIADLCRTGVPVGQLLVEFHHRPGDTASLERTRRAVGRLLDAGYAIFHISPNGAEYSFRGPAAPAKES